MYFYTYCHYFLRNCLLANNPTLKNGKKVFKQYANFKYLLVFKNDTNNKSIYSHNMKQTKG